MRRLWCIPWLRTEVISKIRVTKEEKALILKAYRNSYHSSLAAFVREQLLTKNVSEYQKKKIDALQSLGAFRAEFNRIGNNINQIARALNTYKSGELSPDQLNIMKANAIIFLQIKKKLDNIRL